MTNIDIGAAETLKLPIVKAKITIKLPVVREYVVPPIRLPVRMY